MIYGGKLSLVIPVYNEAESVGKVVRAAQGVDEVDEVIVVDDGSSDGTAEALAGIAGITVITHPYNIGNGAAVREGISRAECDYVLLMDGDGQHSPLDIKKIIEPLDTYDMVVGSRYGNSDVSRFRGIGNWLLIKFAQFLSGTKIDDLTSGFRAMKRSKIMEYVHLFPTKFSYPTTSILAFLHSGYTIKYIPLENVSRRRRGKSSIKPFRDGIRFLQVILRIIMLFNPQKIFLPISILFLLGGTGFAAWTLATSRSVQESSVLLIVIGTFFFFFGLLAEQIASLRRELNRERL